MKIKPLVLPLLKKQKLWSEGDEVTLVATTAGGSELSGWALNYWGIKRCEGFLNQKNIRFTVRAENVTYIAHFNKASDEYYCFIINKGTGRYLKLSKVIDNYSA